MWPIVTWDSLDALRIARRHIEKNVHFAGEGAVGSSPPPATTTVSNARGRRRKYYW